MPFHCKRCNLSSSIQACARCGKSDAITERDAPRSTSPTSLARRNSSASQPLLFSEPASPSQSPLLYPTPGASPSQFLQPPSPQEKPALSTVTVSPYFPPINPAFNAQSGKKTLSQFARPGNLQMDALPFEQAKAVCLASICRAPNLNGQRCDECIKGNYFIPVSCPGCGDLCYIRRLANKRGCADCQAQS